MKVLIVGSGGREHALAWKIAQSPRLTTLYIAPGNGGTALEGENVALSDDDIPGLTAFVRDKGIDLVVAGPEAPLVLGLRESIAHAGAAFFGPDTFAAQLEGSKAFAKTVMHEAGVPTSNFAVFDDFDEARAHLADRGAPVVVKADGLAAGKGVVVCKTLDEAYAALEGMMVKKAFSSAGDRVVIEDCLEGEEASFLAFCDGRDILLMPSSQDHKPVGEGDTGPNTGGMGAYSPAPVLPESDYGRMAELVIRPIVRQMAKLGHPFTGVLYAGIMYTDAGPMVLEYNVRFGDPECQPLLMRLDSDLLEILLACAQGRLGEIQAAWKPETACCVVMAATGYPGSYPKGMAISGIDEAETLAGVKVFQAGTRTKEGADGHGVVTSGGRVLGVTALGDSLAKAKARAYEAVERIRFENSFCRRDIGDKGIRRLAK